MQLLRHPKYDHALASQEQQLRLSIESDRTRAIETFSEVMRAFGALRALGDSDGLSEVHADCEMLLATLKGMDLSQAPDVLAAQLAQIERKLLTNLASIEKFAATMQQTKAQQAPATS